MAAPSVDDLARLFERHPGRAGNRSPRTTGTYREAVPSRITPRTWSTETGTCGSSTSDQVAPTAA